jgi:hypothetical protein
VLLGVLLVVEFFVGLGSSFDGGPLVLSTGDAGPQSILADAGLTVGLRILTGLLFKVLPGAVLLYKGSDWADRLLPPTSDAVSQIEFGALLSIGLMLLGCYFMISGFTGLVGGVVFVAFTEDYAREYAWRSLASSLAMLVSGALVAAVGRRAG